MAPKKKLKIYICSKKNIFNVMSYLHFNFMVQLNQGSEQKVLLYFILLGIFENFGSKLVYHFYWLLGKKDLYNFIQLRHRVDSGSFLGIDLNKILTLAFFIELLDAWYEKFEIFFFIGILYKLGGRGGGSWDKILPLFS